MCALFPPRSSSSISGSFDTPFLEHQQKKPPLSYHCQSMFHFFFSDVDFFIKYIEHGFIIINFDISFYLALVIYYYYLQESSLASICT